MAFIEKPLAEGVAWLMLSDVCKHCVHTGSLDACPTGAMIQTEFGTVVIQDHICNGCEYCVPACHIGMPQLDPHDGGSHKCTLCLDRLLGGLVPACAASGPTGSIRFGQVDRLRNAGRERVAALRDNGMADACFYGDSDLGGTGSIGGLNAMFVLNGPPPQHRASRWCNGSRGHWVRDRGIRDAAPTRPMNLASTPRGAEVEQTRPRGYYDVPVLHGFHWKWLVIWYFFLGGISGTAAMIAAVPRLTGGTEVNRLARAATYVSFAALMSCSRLGWSALTPPVRR